MHMMLAICAIGLVAHKTIPWAAASCDGIALVRWPSTGDHVVCSVEFKTCVAPGTLEQAFAVREHLEELIVVENVGDPRWFESITEDHRAQVLHQMFVSGLKHFVYVRASMTDIIYCVLGRASDDAIDRFGRAVLSVGESLLSWAHPTGDTSEVVIPNWIDESDKRLLQSHLPFWRMVQEHVNRNGPLVPIETFKHAAQVLYCKTKGGVDKATFDVNKIRYPKSKLGFEAKYVTHLLYQACGLNACIAYR